MSACVSACERAFLRASVSVLLPSLALLVTVQACMRASVHIYVYSIHCIRPRVRVE